MPEKKGMTEGEIALGEHGVDPRILSPEASVDVIKETMESMDKAVGESACPVCDILTEKLNTIMVDSLKKAKDFSTAKVIVGLAEYRDNLVSMIQRRCKEMEQEKLKAQEKEIKSSE